MVVVVTMPMVTMVTMMMMMVVMMLMIEWIVHGQALGVQVLSQHRVKVLGSCLAKILG